MNGRSKNEKLSPIHAVRPQVNPYKYSALEIWRRMRWDLKFESHKSRRKIKMLSNSANQEKAIILCNGPSLNSVDFELLDASGIPTFGLNKIDLLFSKTDFRPSFIVAVNQLVIEQNSGFFNSTNIPIFLNSEGSNSIRNRKNVIKLHMVDRLRFARNCSASVVTGFTVTYVAMQLAFHMGFRKVALVGCDHNFKTDDLPNSTQLAESRDENHFSKDYFSGVPWQVPDLPGSEYFYSLAGRTYSSFGGEIVNSTEGGKLEIFRRMPLKSFLES